MQAEMAVNPGPDPDAHARAIDVEVSFRIHASFVAKRSFNDPVLPSGLRGDPLRSRSAGRAYDPDDDGVYLVLHPRSV